MVMRMILDVLTGIRLEIKRNLHFWRMIPILPSRFKSKMMEMRLMMKMIIAGARMMLGSNFISGLSKKKKKERPRLLRLKRRRSMKRQRKRSWRSKRKPPLKRNRNSEKRPQQRRLLLLRKLPINQSQLPRRRKSQRLLESKQEWLRRQSSLRRRLMKLMTTESNTTRTIKILIVMRLIGISTVDLPLRKPDKRLLQLLLKSLLNILLRNWLPRKKRSLPLIFTLVIAKILRMRNHKPS